MNNFFNCSSPLEQFEIVTLVPIEFINFNFSFTNASLFLLIAIFVLILFFYIILKNKLIVPNSWQVLSEFTYEAAMTIVQDNIGEKGEKYFPLIFVIFIVLLFCNILGLVPYSFTVTSHIAFTFGLALAIFIGINLIGIQIHGFHFFAIFLPKGAPLGIVPILVVIEFISYIVKVFTLAIRLFANMTSGHTLLKIIAGFAWTILTFGGLVSFLHIIPLIILFALIGLELGIALLQAYVFALLTCIYLNDVIDIH